jgi:hypothetical protein
MYVMKDRLDQLEENHSKVIQIFLSKKVRSGSRIIIPDPDPQHRFLHLLLSMI